jgi:hypothetical protein
METGYQLEVTAPSAAAIGRPSKSDGGRPPVMRVNMAVTTKGGPSGVAGMRN